MRGTPGFSSHVSWTFLESAEAIYAILPLGGGLEQLAPYFLLSGVNVPQPATRARKCREDKM